MFTRNYIEFQKTRFTANSRSYSYTRAIKNVAGSTVYAYASNFYVTDIGGWLRKPKCQVIQAQQTGTSCDYSDYAGVYFGGGSTPATESDYCLESPITSGLSITEPSSLVWTEDGKGKYGVEVEYIITNTTGADVNIWEVGVITPTATSNNLTDQTVNHVLMERTVLTEPITIPPGEIKLVTYKITFNQTLNVD